MLIQRIRIVMIFEYKIELWTSWKPSQKEKCDGSLSLIGDVKMCQCFLLFLAPNFERSLSDNIIWNGC